MCRKSFNLSAVFLVLICLSASGWAASAHAVSEFPRRSIDTSAVGTSAASRKAVLLLAERSERRMRGSRRGNKEEGSGSASENELCVECEALDGFVPPDKISDEIRMMVGKGRGFDKARAVGIQKARGGIETGLVPAFIGGAACPEIDSEKWAIDYSYKRDTVAIHWAKTGRLGFDQKTIRSHLGEKAVLPFVLNGYLKRGFNVSKMA